MCFDEITKILKDNKDLHRLNYLNLNFISLWSDTILNYIVENNIIEQLRYILSVDNLKIPIDIDIVDLHQKTALISAVIINDIKITEILLKHKANTEIGSVIQKKQYILQHKIKIQK